MNGEKLYLDTNIILYLLNGDQTLAELLDGKQLYVSVITELELLAFNGLRKEEENTIKEFLSECSIVNLSEEVKQKTIYIRKKHHTKLPDSIIIGTALHLDLPLITSDSDFKKITETKVLFYQK